MFDPLTPQEWSAIELSLRVAAVAALASLPFGIADRLAARPRPLRRALAGRRHRPPAAGHAAGGHRLSAAARLRHQGAGRRLAQKTLRHRPRLQLDRRGAGRRHHGLPADGARHPPVDRGDRPAARRGRRDPRRPPHRHPRDGHPAAGAPRHPRRRRALLCAGARRVRRHHHLRRQHSRRHPDHAARRSTPTPRCPAASCRRCA